MLLRCLALAFALVAGPALAADTLTLKWPDLVPVNAKDAGISLPTGLVQHGELLPPIDFKTQSPFSRAYRESISNPRALQPKGSEVRDDLNGKRVRIAGYVTPIGFDGTRVTDFLLAPYVGACIHVPPPPANQIVMVTDAQGLDMTNLDDPVWIEGSLQVTPVSMDLADVGYQIVGAKVTRYK
jgi:hypothetical protein